MAGIDQLDPILARQGFNNLAGLYRDQGQYDQAKPLWVRALSIYKQQLGPEHLNTARYLNNLANLYYAQEKYDQAEALWMRALSIYE